jgi:hypothetical protein
MLKRSYAFQERVLIFPGRLFYKDQNSCIYVSFNNNGLISGIVHTVRDFICAKNKNYRQLIAPMDFEVIKVECYSGYKVNERPVAFTYKGKRWEVDDIIDRWYEGNIESGQPAMDYFKVRTTEGKEFLLRYNSLFDAWAVLVSGTTMK